MRLKAAAIVPRRRAPCLSDPGMPNVEVIADEHVAAEPIKAGSSFDDLCATWIEGFQVQFVLAFRDGYSAGDRGKRPAPGDHSLPDRQVVAAEACHVLGAPLAVARASRYERSTLSKVYKHGEREGQRIGYAFGWKAIQTEIKAAMRLQRQWDRGREGSENDLRALGDGTATDAARRMMLPARLARNLGVKWTLPPMNDPKASRKPRD